MSDTDVDADHVGERDDGPGDEVAARPGPGRVQAVLVIVPLVVGLLVVAGVGARMLLAEIPEAAEVAEVVDVTCWNGKTRPAEECTEPTGRAGLRWVFPSFKPDLLGCRNVLRERPAFKRPTMFECDGRVGGSKVTITYSELNGVTPGRRYLEKEYGHEPEEVDGGRLLWKEDEPGDGVHELDLMYADHPFAVEVRARSAQARDRALDTLVRLRPVDAIRIRP